MIDRLSLATNVRKARRHGVCSICRVPIIRGQQIARLIRPAGWCHVGCVPVVAAIKTSAGSPPAAAPKE
jgi:hypothetical protein